MILRCDVEIISKIYKFVSKLLNSFDVSYITNMYTRFILKNINQLCYQNCGCRIPVDDLLKIVPPYVAATQSIDCGILVTRFTLVIEVIKLHNVTHLLYSFKCNMNRVSVRCTVLVVTKALCSHYKLYTINNGYINLFIL